MEGPRRTNWRYGLAGAGCLLGLVAVPAVVYLYYRSGPGGGSFAVLTEFFHDACIGSVIGFVVGGLTGYLVGANIDFAGPSK